MQHLCKEFLLRLPTFHEDCPLHGIYKALTLLLKWGIGWRVIGIEVPLDFLLRSLNDKEVLGYGGGTDIQNIVVVNHTEVVIVLNGGGSN